MFLGIGHMEGNVHVTKFEKNDMKVMHGFFRGVHTFSDPQYCADTSPPAPEAVSPGHPAGEPPSQDVTTAGHGTTKRPAWSPMTGP